MCRPSASWTVLLLLAGCVIADPETGSSAAKQLKPDTIYFNAAVHPMAPFAPCPGKSSLEAVALKANEIFAVGCDDDVLALAKSSTRLVDLDGRALLPGLVDAHAHLTPGFEEIEFAQEWLLSHGITSAAEKFAYPTKFDVFRRFEAEGRLRVRMTLQLPYNSACNDYVDYFGVPLGNWYLAYQPKHDPQAMLRWPGIKIYSDDGVCGPFAMSFDYFPEEPFNGNLWLTADQIAAIASEANAHGWRVAIHAVGDRGQDHTLAGLAQTTPPPGLHNNIEHNHIVRPDQVPLFGQLGLPPVVFGEIPTCALNEDKNAYRFLSPDKRSWYRPVRSLIEQNPGLPVAWSRDGGTLAIDPMYSLYQLVTRREVAEDGTICMPGPELAAEGITVEQALTLMTINAARVLGTDSAVGSLAAGKRADLIVLSADPFAIPAEELRDLKVLLTVVNGHTEYCDPSDCPQP